MPPYPQAEAHGGKLLYRAGIPILITEGGPEQVGQQVGALAMRYATQLYSYPLDYLKAQIRVPLLPYFFWLLLKRKCRQLYAQLPEADRAEVAALARTCPDGGRLVPGNTLFDMTIGLRPLFGCSSFLVSPERSANGNLLFGRNLDFEPLNYLFKYSLVQIYKANAKRLGFASIAFPGFVGCFSGMNETGFSMARHEVIGPNVPRAYNSHGVPFGAALRRVLETCRTVREAVAYLSPIPHATVSIVIVADAQESAILEVTPDGVFERPKQMGLVGCSNHFLHPSLQNPKQPNEYVTLERHETLQQYANTGPEKFGVAEVWNALHQVHQEELTLQSMVFEPAARAIHLGFGEGPTTARPPQTIHLDEFLTKQ